ncbi:MAG: hypothetical protein OES26_25200, partial [Gammaproteobacteria bacterium]|nr:hypothetical protein [Gammaproteobacteria bacterium]
RAAMKLSRIRPPSRVKINRGAPPRRGKAEGKVVAKVVTMGPAVAPRVGAPSPANNALATNPLRNALQTGPVAMTTVAIAVTNRARRPAAVRAVTRNPVAVAAVVVAGVKVDRDLPSPAGHAVEVVKMAALNHQPHNRLHRHNHRHRARINCRLARPRINRRQVRIEIRRITNVPRRRPLQPQIQLRRHRRPNLLNRRSHR